MAKEDVHLIWVLDKSGSMGNVVTETIKGFNQFMREQAAQPGKAYLTLTLFDTKIDERFEAAPVHLVPEMELGGLNGYQASGGTALYDAVGVTILRSDKWCRDNPNFDGRIIFVIFTDGQERDSDEWTIGDLNDLIKLKQEDGWEFIFLGSGGAAWTEGKNFEPVAMTLNLASTPTSTYDSYVGVSASVTATRQKGMSLRNAFHANTAHLQQPDVDPPSDVRT